MPEVAKEVKTLLVKLICEKCSSEMAWTGIASASDPPQYPHKCPKCGYKETAMGQNYPFIRYGE